MVGVDSAYAAGITIPAGAALSFNAASLRMPSDIANAAPLQFSSGAVTVTSNRSNTGTFTPGNSTVTLSRRKLELKVNKKNIVVTLRGDDGCAVEEEDVMVRMDNGGKRCISVSPLRLF